MEKRAAVLTGDLIGSTGAGPNAVDHAMRALADAAAHLSQEAACDTRFTRFRGDGWQIYLDHPRHALRAALLMTAALRATEKGLATRISVGIGQITRLGDKGLSDASGDAFVISGHGLDLMPKSKRLVIAGGGVDAKWHTPIFDLVEWQSGRWSREQAEAVMLALGPDRPSFRDIAAGLGISRQALQARLSSAGYHALEEALHTFETDHDHAKDTA
jgi:hypothetical protein